MNHQSSLMMRQPLLRLLRWRLVYGTEVVCR
jgi:hypothetical protein